MYEIIMNTNNVKCCKDKSIIALIMIDFDSYIRTYENHCITDDDIEEEKEEDLGGNGGGHGDCDGYGGGGSTGASTFKLGYDDGVGKRDAVGVTGWESRICD
ncbi:Hypothetical predicted protein [Octopus vulgaris]|uniref:Uncharacterized protein n=1 Tax=Octopus vulgaris TaxID=6645 RepID=A0AA36F016_OCTVU|nr:Hypothetical predicted protein [Octopus vulgaris]